MRLLSLRYLFLTALTAALVMALAACGGAVSTATPTPTSEQGADWSEENPPPEDLALRSVGSTVGDKAPEFTGLNSWINSDPLTLEQLRGKVVLVDFWTYTCINCIRTFPYLKEWQEKYADVGLVIVGVHSPEFEFEKVRENVVKSAQESGLVYPIAQDNDFRTWRAYSNRFWPAKYLVDHQGTVRYTHFGEGAYLETEQVIRALLTESGADLSSTPLGTDDGPTRDPAALIPQDPESFLTRELYGGYERNANISGLYIAHQEYYDGSSRTLHYIDPQEHLNGHFYLQGLWYNDAESIVHARQTEELEDYIALKFAANEVNAVIDPQMDRSFIVEVSLDGRPLSADEAGVDMVVRDDRSYFQVTGARIYRVVALPEYGVHELRLASNSPEFALFAFTFGAYTPDPGT